ncbi:hypothetical protein [Tabrizicola sp.]|uniref:hypothetical protein n=1 Tax=Tabrizicola sp. TaxID=2005166 RepID=UPI0035B19E25
MRVRTWVAGFALLAAPARAECTGGGCYDGLAQLVQAVLAYGLIGIVLLVLLIVPRWRRTGFRGLLLVLMVAVGVPLVSQAWQRIQRAWMETGEVLGQPPRMSLRTPLLIAPDWACRDDLCAAVLMGQGARGAYALRLEALSGRDMAQPLVLADLPLERWTEGAGGEPRQQRLTATEKAEALAQIDYLILIGKPFHQDGPGPLEAGLGLGEKVFLRLAMVPLTAGTERLDLTAMAFDVLDLDSRHRALGIPLAPGNWGTLWSDPLDPDLVARSLCGRGAEEPEWTCLNAAWR